VTQLAVHYTLPQLLRCAQLSLEGYLIWDETSGSCSTHVIDETCIQKRRDHSEDLAVDIIMDLREIGREEGDWVHLAQERDQ
jgi:hypothetical protein